MRMKPMTMIKQIAELMASGEEFNFTDGDGSSSETYFYKDGVES